MANESYKRKISAILSADVVGFSRLMGDNEAATVSTLKAYQETVAIIIKQHHGRIIDSPGDNLLAEFASVVNAVQCAVEIQQVIKARNTDLPQDRKMEFRIGINLGDVIEEGDRIYGDGVNIAARIEGLADAGGICISGSAYEQIETKLALGYVDLGEHAVKNISKPVRVYRIPIDSSVASDKSKAKGKATKKWRIGGIIAAIILIVVIGSVVLLNNVTQKGLPVREDTQQASAINEDYTVPGFGGAPAIAVLPFDNLSKDPDQEYFADGIAEDLITRLSSWRSFPVIARNSSFTYKGQAVDIRQVGRELGVRYVVEGSVRKTGNQLRISAQLIDAKTGAYIWADRYDRKFKEIFVIQDEITSAIAASMGASLTAAEVRRMARPQSQNLTAYDLMMRGRWTFSQASRSGLNHPLNVNEARVFLEKALELNQQYAMAWALLARTYLNDSYQPAENRDMLLSKAEEAAKKSILFDPQLPDSYRVLAGIHQVRREKEDMFRAINRAIELNPSYADAYRTLGFFLAESNQPDEALTILDKGIRLSPNDPVLSEFFRGKCRAYFALGRYDKAAEWAKSSIHQGGTSIQWLDLAASQAHLGLLEEAKISFQKARELAPYQPTVTGLQRTFSYIDEDFNKRWFDGLRKAGLPE